MNHPKHRAGRYRQTVRRSAGPDGAARTAAGRNRIGARAADAVPFPAQVHQYPQRHPERGDDRRDQPAHELHQPDQRRQIAQVNRQRPAERAYKLPPRPATNKTAGGRKQAGADTRQQGANAGFHQRMAEPIPGQQRKFIRLAGQRPTKYLLNFGAQLFEQAVGHSSKTRPPRGTA